MAARAMSRAQLLREIESLRAKLEEAEGKIRAVRDGGADPLPVRDPSDEKQHEEPIEAEGLGQSILEHVADAVVVCDSGLWITQANAEARRLCGRNPVREQFDAVFPLQFGTEPVGDPRALLMRVLGGYSLQKTEARMANAKGTWVDLLLMAEPLRSEGETIIGCVVTLTDITQDKRAQAASQEAKEQAEAASRGKDEFLATLSHELRTPLSPVLMSASAMETRQDLPADVRGELSMIRRNVELEARLIDDLLDLTRISRGKLELDFQVVDACVLLHQTVEICAAEASAKGLRLSVDVEEGRHYLLADMARLQQVFWNLIKNAIKFTPAPGEIWVRCFGNEGGNVVVEVKDTGIGIEPDLIPRLFSPFEQGGREMTRRFGGLGLGLAICQGLVTLHGGSLRASSEGHGRGTTFTVELPAEPAPAPMAERPRETAVVGLARMGGRLRILLVEDHQDTARTMAHLLESYGHEAQVARGVGAALELAEQQQFDLVIGDLGLPDGSGLDLMRELKRRYDLMGIAVSGYGMQDDIEKSLQAGYLQHIVKPINTQKLEAVIQSLVDRVLAGKRTEERQEKQGSGEGV
jgi:two-component system CheB/CheR fusion protein